MSKTALVIGGTGFLGTAIVESLIANGFDVSALARGQKPRRVQSARFIQADRSNLGNAIGSVQYDLVVDCAAYKLPDVVSAIAALSGRTNHYFFISTDFVYRALPDLHFPLNEDAPKQTTAPYGVGKLQCEDELLKAFAENKFPATILRPPHILGHGNLLGCDFSQMRDPKVLEFIRNGEGLTLTADGQFLIQPVHHREVGEAITALSGKQQTIGQIFNLAGPNCVTTRHYYEIVAAELNVPLRYKSISLDEMLAKKPDAIPIARHRVYDITRLKTAGYVPHFPLKESLIETIKWIQRPQ